MYLNRDGILKITLDLIKLLFIQLLIKLAFNKTRYGQARPVSGSSQLVSTD